MHLNWGKYCGAKHMIDLGAKCYAAELKVQAMHCIMGYVQKGYIPYCTLIRGQYWDTSSPEADLGASNSHGKWQSD